MTSSNGNIFRVTGLLWGESSGSMLKNVRQFENEIPEYNFEHAIDTRSSGCRHARVTMVILVVHCTTFCATRAFGDEIMRQRRKRPWQLLRVDIGKVSQISDFLFSLYLEDAEYWSDLKLLALCWWRYDMKPSSSLLTLCERNPTVTGDLVINNTPHYNDVIMSAMTSQITSLTIVYSTVYSRRISKENIKTPRHWPLWGEITGDRWIPRTKGQQHGKCFHLMTSSCYQHRNNHIQGWHCHQR